MNIHELDAMISAVCPIDGINSSGEIWFKLEATPAQKLSAQGIMEANIASVTPHALTLAEAITDRIAEITDLQNSKLFSNFDATFPAGVKTIQIRNSDDWLNILTVMTRAMTLAGSTSITFKTADNAIQTLTAAQFIVIGQAVMEAKEAIKAQGDTHDAAIRACANIAEVQAYDITTGW